MSSFPVKAQGAPEAPPSPPVNPWPGTKFTWIGWNGRAFDLAGGDHATGVALREGTRGLNMPPIEHHESETEARPGSRWISSRTLKREMLWQVGVYQDTSSQDWIDYDDSWWETLHPEKPGQLIATKPDGTTRSLPCRYADDGGHELSHSPGLFHWMHYAIAMQAEQPYWRGTPEVRSWPIGADSVSFIGPNGLRLARARTTATATIDNPGNVDEYVTWTAKATGAGIAAGAKFGVGENLVGFSQPLTAGDVLVVNTREMTARLNGVRVSRFLTPRNPVPVPAGQANDLVIDVSGTGEIQAVLTPSFFRAT